MSASLSQLQLRQKELQEVAVLERLELAIHFQPLKKPLSWADKGLDAIHFVQDTPFLWTSIFAILAHFKPKLASKVLAFGFGALKLARGVKNLI
ncbi:YqjK-like protein [Polynucleobacter meluiroseus]|uniref:YqjK-like protein n=1 Tax=Polynucleobacter meluiroseus TaxID=1938814 RepID=A0A240E2B5_9BURK|nr:YqjK-like family protein [Polynucleobacter meluiroseus]SNX28641.1 YqjK-like protein [Polynucleobacter meluiroseus]